MLAKTKNLCAENGKCSHLFFDQIHQFEFFFRKKGK
jgi:hypothetical protein